MLANPSTAQCPGARHVIHRTVNRCSPRRPLHRVPVLATSATAECTDARHVNHRIVYRCSPRHSPHSVPMLAIHRIDTSKRKCTMAVFISFGQLRMFRAAAIEHGRIGVLSHRVCIYSPSLALLSDLSLRRAKHATASALSHAPLLTPAGLAHSSLLLRLCLRSKS